MIYNIRSQLNDIQGVEKKDLNKYLTFDDAIGHTMYFLQRTLYMNLIKIYSARK